MVGQLRKGYPSPMTQPDPREAPPRASAVEAALRTRVWAPILRALTWLAAPAARPGDSDTERLRHICLVALALLMSAGGVLWGVLTIALHAPWQYVIPFGYVVATALNLGGLRVHRTFAITRTTQIGMSLALPFLLQWALGGFEASGVMMLWSMLALVGALTVQSARSTLAWLAAYLSWTLLSALIDPVVHQHVIVVDDRQQVLALTLNLCVIPAIVFGMMAYFVRSVERLSAALSRSNQENAALVHRMLPVLIAERLRGGADIIADHLDETTVVFCDIVGFTRWAQEAPPIEVVDTLRRLFSAFDAASRAHGLEKIKTIGDAYMAAAGVPVPQADHLTRALALAMDLIRIAANERTPQGEPLAVRVGLHAGPLVAGVIGQDKVLYDIWGPTVNLAARLEASGEAGYVHVDAATRARLGDAVTAIEREPLHLKGLGPTRTFLIRPPAA